MLELHMSLVTQDPKKVPNIFPFSPFTTHNTSGDLAHKRQKVCSLGSLSRSELGAQATCSADVPVEHSMCIKNDKKINCCFCFVHTHNYVHDPGSGKTWTTKHLSYYLATSLFERTAQDKLKMKAKFVEVYMVCGGLVMRMVACACM